MVFVVTMEGDSDEELSFIHIAAATANVLRWLEVDKVRNDKPENEESKPDRSNDAGKEAGRGEVAVIVKKRRKV